MVDQLFDLSRPRRIHIVGVGGPGMSAIALVLADMGNHVRGSDIKHTPYLDRVELAGVDVRIGHAAENLDDVEVVCISTAIRANNLEVAEAGRRSIPVLRRAEMLAAICSRARSIGVAGTHGKTSTTSMLALILRAAGLDPSFIVGGQLNDVGAGATWTGGELLVVEADESDGTFLALPLAGTILTNVEVDHLDHFGTVDTMHRAFAEYLDAADGPIVVCADDPVAARLAGDARRDRPVITYGLHSGADYRLTDVRSQRGVQHFTVVHSTRNGTGSPTATVLGDIELPVRGIHMATNALAAIAMALELGASFDDARRALARFGGVARRFEIRGRAKDATLVDDYAHLPGEIAAVLRAARTGGDDWRRVIAVFQPNRYSRMDVLWREYADAFVDADVVVLTDIYPSGEVPLPGVTGKLVVNAVLDAHPATRVMYLPNRSDLIAVVARELRAGDVCISMGCGDIAAFPDEVLDLVERLGPGR
ncbi:MAG: UDP-N-acetylmuramate--L-alanine ligase [Acidimicrobiia bacterium]